MKMSRSGQSRFSSDKAQSCTNIHSGPANGGRSFCLQHEL